MRHSEVTLDDKFLLTEGRVFITGVQALLRVLIPASTLSLCAARVQSHGISRSTSSVCGVRRSQSIKPMMHCALRPRRNMRSGWFMGEV